MSKSFESRLLGYGLSITDACVGWEDTGKLVDKPFASAASRRRLKP
jgi:phospho-2-dehydro-3-deoxyheptonate aldolase